MKDRNESIKNIFGPYIWMALPLQMIGMIFFFGAFMIDIFDSMFFIVLGIILLTIGCLIFIRSMKLVNK